MYEYKDDNKFVIGIIVLGFVLLTAWVCHDLARNKPIYSDTDNTMADIENRMSAIEQRVDTIQGRLAETQKTVTSITERVNTSTGLAREIADGIGSAESRLDSAIQRSGRIQNIIEEIERTNKPGKKDS